MRREPRRLRRLLGKGAEAVSAVLISAVLLCLVAPDAWAQVTGIITLDQALEAALKFNASILQAENQVTSSTVTADQARKELYPDLSANLSASRVYSRTQVLPGGVGDYEARDAFNAGVSSSITLFDGFGSINQIRKSDLNLSAGLSTYSYVAQSVVFATLSAYFDVLMNQELVESQRKNLDAQRQRLALVEELESAGNRSLADVLQQRAMVAQAELQVIEAEHQTSLSKLELVQAMGLQPRAEFEAVALGPEDISVTPPVGPEDRMVSRALDARADVAAQRQEVEAGSRAVAVAQAGYWPSLSLGVSAASSYSSMNEYSTFSNQIIEDNPTFQVGLSMAIPIFDRARTASSVEQARLSLENEEIKLAELERQIALEVRQALFEYETAVERLEVAEAQLEYAAEALEATTARYQVGSATLVEVTTSDAQNVDARNETVRSAYALLLSQVALNYRSGTIGEVLPSLSLSHIQQPDPSEG